MYEQPKLVVKAEARIHERIRAIAPGQHLNSRLIESTNQIGVNGAQRNHFCCDINRQRTPVVAEHLRNVHQERVVPSTTGVGDLDFLIEHDESWHLPCVVSPEPLE